MDVKELTEKEFNELFYLPDDLLIEMEYNRKLFKFITKITLLKLRITEG